MGSPLDRAIRPRSSPCLSDAPDQRRINDHVPKRCNRGHICPPVQTVRLHQNGYLTAISARTVRNPPDVHYRVDCPVCQLCCPLGVREIDRGEGERLELGRDRRADRAATGYAASARGSPRLSRGYPNPAAPRASSGSRTGFERTRMGWPLCRPSLVVEPVAESHEFHPESARPRHRRRGSLA